MIWWGVASNMIVWSPLSGMWIWEYLFFTGIGKMGFRPGIDTNRWQYFHGCIIIMTCSSCLAVSSCIERIHLLTWLAHWTQCDVRCWFILYVRGGVMHTCLNIFPQLDEQNSSCKVNPWHHIRRHNRVAEKAWFYASHIDVCILHRNYMKTYWFY